MKNVQIIFPLSIFISCQGWHMFDDYYTTPRRAKNLIWFSLTHEQPSWEGGDILYPSDMTQHLRGSPTLPPIPLEGADDPQTASSMRHMDVFPSPLMAWVKCFFHRAAFTPPPRWSCPARVESWPEGTDWSMWAAAAAASSHMAPHRTSGVQQHPQTPSPCAWYYP